MKSAAVLDAARSYWQQLDLTYLADTMCADSYPLPRWTRQDALHCIRLYKNFLWLHKQHPAAVLVPTREIDECWHNHILHTRQAIESNDLGEIERFVWLCQLIPSWHPAVITNLETNPILQAFFQKK